MKGESSGLPKRNPSVPGFQAFTDAPGITARLHICLVSPFPPPYGGMAIQGLKLAACLRRAGFQVHTVATNQDLPAPLRNVQSIPGLRTIANMFIFLRKFHEAARRSDVVCFLTGFFNFFFWITYPALICSKLMGRPVVLSARGGGAADFFAKWKPVIAPIIRQVALITTPSGFLQKAFIDSFGITPVVVPNIVDLSQFSFKEREVFRPRLIVTRNLDPIYNVECVIRAFRKIKDRFPDARLSVVGDGSERARLEELVEAIGLTDSVTFHGQLRHEQVQVLYAENDIAVNASNVDNLPGSILEAWACGLPQVSTRAGGIPYMIEDGVTGLLVEMNDCDALAAKVVELLENPDLARRLASNGRRACETYSSSLVMEILLPLLIEVAERRKA